MASTSYALGLGSNRPHGRYGSPARVLAAALHTLEDAGCRVVASAPIIATPPLGPGRRRFANSAAIIETGLEPLALLDRLKAIERRFGRRRGRRWGDRVLDLDILLWEGGRVRGRRLIIPHAELADRAFVLRPLATIAADWRVPPGGLRVRHLEARRAHRLSRANSDHRPCFRAAPGS